MQKEFTLKSKLTGDEYSFTATLENSSPDGRQFIKTIQSGITGSMYVQRLEVQRKYFQLNVLFSRKDMSVLPVTSGVAIRGSYQQLMNFIEESVVEMIDWNGTRYSNAIIISSDVVITPFTPTTYPRTAPLEIIVP